MRGRLARPAQERRSSSSRLLRSGGDDTGIMARRCLGGCLGRGRVGGGTN